MLPSWKGGIRLLQVPSHRVLPPGRVESIYRVLVNRNRSDRDFGSKLLGHVESAVYRGVQHDAFRDILRDHPENAVRDMHWLPGSNLPALAEVSFQGFQLAGSSFLAAPCRACPVSGPACPWSGRLDGTLGSLVLRSADAFAMRRQRGWVAAIRLGSPAFTRLWLLLDCFLTAVSTLTASSTALCCHHDQFGCHLERHGTLRGKDNRLPGFVKSPRGKIETLADLINARDAILDLLYA